MKPKPPSDPTKPRSAQAKPESSAENDLQTLPLP